MADSWAIRKSNISHDEVISMYDGFPNLFTLEIHHGGRITNPPNRVYVGGTINSVDLVDIDRFSIHELDLMLNELGWSATEPMFYHFLNPTKTLNNGLEDLGCDQDVVNLTRFVGENKVIQVYIQHGLKNMMEFFASPSKVKPKITIEEIDEPNPLAIVPGGKNLFGASSSSHKEDVAAPTDSDPFDFDFLNEHGNTDQESQDNEMDFEADAGRENAKLVTEDGVSIDDEAEAVTEVHGWREQHTDDEGGEVHVADEQGYEVGEVHVSDEQGNAVDDEDMRDVTADDLVDVQIDDAVGNDDTDEESADDQDIDYDESHNNMEDDIEVDMTDYHTYVDHDVDEQLNENEDEDLEVLDNDTLNSGSDSDEYETSKRKHFLHRLRENRKNEIGSDKSVEFYIGQSFGTKEEAKELVKRFSVQTRRKLRIKKNDSERLRICCDGDMPNYEVDDNGVHVHSKRKGKEIIVEKESQKANKKSRACMDKKKSFGLEKCNFVLYIAKAKKEESWVVKTLINEHKCLQSRTIKACTAEFISNQMIDQIQENPHIPVKAVQEQYQKKLEVGISKMKAYRARCLAKRQVHGDYRQQYELLWDYANELRDKNPDTTVRIELEPCTDPTASSRQFKRMYICYGALKKGFKALGRDLLGLDGAFMKGPFPGQILTAVGIDNNNGIYPLCFAIVEAESLSSWTWFLKNLGEDLDLNSASNFTFISDRQKGHLPAITKIYPWAEHRYCLRHIHENMKLTFRGKLYKDLLWKAATTTTVPEFKKVMEEIKEANTDAFTWLSKIPFAHWTRSHFTGRAKTDVLLNNMCEVFNGKIVEGRDKPIIGALEYIREYLMRRIVTVMKVQERQQGLLTPNATIMLEKIKKEAAHYHVVWNGGELYQVHGKPQHHRVVDLGNKSCSCRKWELTAMPCCHAVAAIWFMATNGGRVGALESWVDPIHSLEKWKEVYSFKLNPINDKSMWEKTPIPTFITPPRHHTPVGRPKKARKRSSLEKEDISSSRGKLSKKATTSKCGSCGGLGHNKRTCKGQGQSGAGGSEMGRGN